MAEPAAFTVEEFTASDGYRWRYRRYAPLQQMGRWGEGERGRRGEGETGRRGEGETKHSSLSPSPLLPISPSPHLAEGGGLAEIVCIHGIQSHAGWYEYSCTRLAQAGYWVSFLDRRGSGMNADRRGDAPGFRRLLDDLAEYLRHRRATAPRLHLLAISWGGKLAVALQRRHPGLVDSLALLCPGFVAKVRPPLGQRLAIAASRLVRPTRLFPVPLNDPELFTANPKWLEFLRHDPLALRQATARLLIESVRLDMYLRFCPRHVRVPVLLLLAGRDRIIANDRTRRYVERFATADKTVIEYPEAHHTLEFEPDPDRWLGDLLTWLGKH